MRNIITAPEEDDKTNVTKILTEIDEKFPKITTYSNS